MNHPLWQSAQLRQRAEAQLARGKSPDKHPTDPLRVLHELQVHQIELELQNEELVRANLELERLRLKYQSFYDEAPVGYLTLNRHGDIVELNASAQRMLRREPAAVIGLPMRASFAAESQPDFDQLLQDTEGGELVVSREYLLIQRPAGVPMFVKAQARRQVAPADTETLLLLVIVDVTALKFAMDDVISTIRK